MKYLILLIIVLVKNIQEIKDINENNRLELLDVYFKKIPLKIEQVIHCGSDFKNIFILGRKSEIYFSDDYGKIWKDMSVNFQINHKTTDFKFSEIYQNHNDKKHIIFVQENGSHFETLNCDENIKPILNGKRLKDFLFHPRNKNYILVNYYEDCFDKNEECKKDWVLKLSKDQGNNWISLKSNVLEFCWAKYHHKNIESTRIFYIEKSFNSKILNYTDDFFKNSVNIFNNVYSMELTHHFIFLDTDKKFSKYVADTWGDLYTFHPIKFDLLENKDIKTMIINSHNKDLTYMNVIWKENEIEISRLFLSDFWAKKYQSILDYVVCDYGDINCDVYIVKSIEGVIIANVYDDKYINSLLNEVPNTESFNTRSELLQNNIKTVISYDYGKTWNFIKKPLYNSKNKLFDCYDCSLHFFMTKIKKDYEQGEIISQKSTPGIILGEGIVGKNLFEFKNEIGLYLSEDGGSNWKEILTGEYVYSMIDQGGFILAGVKNDKTEFVKFSTDYGNSWKEIKISEYKIFISKIIVESLEKENKFLVIGHEKESSKEDIIISINLKDFHDKICQFSENIEVSDYEIFTPYRIAGSNNCYNGREIEFLRKKKDRNCYNNKKKELYNVKKLCKCTEQDWNCNFGYKRDKNNKCVIITPENVDPNLIINNYQGFKNIEKNNSCINNSYRKNPYIKITTSYCEGGIDYGNTYLPCKTSFNFSFYKIFYFLFLIIIIYFIYSKLKDKFSNENFKNYLNIIKNNITKNKNKKDDDDTVESDYKGPIMRPQDDIFDNDELFEDDENEI